MQPLMKASSKPLASLSSIQGITAIAGGITLAVSILGLLEFGSNIVAQIIIAILGAAIGVYIVVIRPRE
jgi:hypothetical protein